MTCEQLVRELVQIRLTGEVWVRNEALDAPITCVFPQVDGSCVLYPGHEPMTIWALIGRLCETCTPDSKIQVWHPNTKKFIPVTGVYELSAVDGEKYVTLH